MSGRASGSVAASASATATASATQAGNRVVRLKIKSMTLENFKSYYGVKTIGPFDDSFTCVVGPNGSGKSNVIDAMMFVFGKRATKMRLKKVSELIHNSDEHRDVEYCRVTVDFHEVEQSIDGGDGAPATVLPNTEISVTRTADRSNNSSYKLNGRTSSFTEVQELLKGKGVDLDNNRFLILQGEVELISQLKPKGLTPDDEGMLEFLEEIIGTSKYVKDIETAGTQVEQLNDERQQRINRLKLAERERDSLNEGKLEAEEYLRREDELSVRRSELSQLGAWEAQNRLQAIRDDREKLVQKRDELNASIKEVDAQCAELKKRFGDVGQKSEDTRAKLVALETTLKRLQCEDAKLAENIKHSMTQIKKLRAQLDKDTRAVSENGAALKRLSTSCDALKARLEQIEAENERENAKLAAARETKKGQVAPLEAAVARAGEKSSKIGEQLADSNSSLEEWRLKIEQIGARSAAAKRDLEQARAKLATASERLAQAKRDAQELNKTASTERATEAALRKEQQEIAAKLSAVTAELTQAQQIFEEMRAAQSASAGRAGHGPAGLLARHKAKLPGFRGRLGDLGHIDGKYDVAVTTACGALNNIVVDTFDCAEKCLALLKQHDGGRATFICLDKIQVAEADMNRTGTPEAAPRLFDLVTPAQADLRPAFYFALRDTLVAGDIDHATRLSYQGSGKRWRVVTLSGELVEASGAMTGGGGRPQRGGMQLTGNAQAQRGGASAAAAAAAGVAEVTPAEFEAAQRKCSALSASAEQLKAKKSELSLKLDDAETKARDAERKLKRASSDLETLTALHTSAASRVADLEAASNETADEKRQRVELEGRMQAEEQRTSRERAEQAKLADEIASLKRQIDDVYGVAVKQMRFTLEELRQERERKERERTTAELELQSERDNAAALEDAVRKSAAKVEAADAALVALKAKRSEIEGEATAALKEQGALETERMRLEEEFEEFKTESAKFDKDKAKHQSKLVDVAAQLDDATRVLRETEDKVKQMQKRLVAVQQTHERLCAEFGDLFSEFSELPKLDDAALGKLNRDELSCEVARLEDEVKGMTPNMEAIAEFRRKDQDFRERAAELEAVTKKRDEARVQYDELRKKRLDEFMAGFTQITMKLKEIYQMLTMGGDAELELVDSLDPFSEGIVFTVLPPNKSWKSIINLSGGEKTLSSLALIFALHHYKPTPIYVMDEIDAALDFKNVSIVANYIKERTKDAQFLVISLRNNMFELADRLVGIYKTDNQTKSVTIQPALCRAVAV